MSSIDNILLRTAAWPFLLTLLLCQRMQGQNLVPNPSFEEVNTCAEYNQPCSPSAWFFLSRKLTTGYFPRFPSATGSRHLQIAAASRTTPNRQYWETMLLCPLRAGERYAVSLKVASPSPGDKTRLSRICPNLHDIGMWFTDRFVFVQGDSILQPRNYFSLTGATTRDLKNGWFEIRKEFVPGASSTILIVGNFFRAANAEIMAQRSPPTPGSAPTPTIDVLVDDISVVPLKGTICSGYQRTKDSLYAITWRHSDTDPRDPDAVEEQAPGPSLTPPDTTPPDDPLFGPEPRRLTDTPRLPAPAFPATPLLSPVPVLPPLPRQATDTIVIHNIQFDFDKYLMQNPDTLERYRSLLTRPGIKKIQVVGFTDDTGPETYNLDLSIRRAHEIAALLSSKLDIPPALIEAEGRGISRKYSTKDLNRRVEIYIFHE